LLKDSLFQETHGELQAFSLAHAQRCSPAQMAGAVLTGADLTGARLTGDLSPSEFVACEARSDECCADMKNQSMGLMRTNIVNAKVLSADMTDSDFSVRT